MPDYSKGLIYKISVDGQTYYGSTVQSLKRRMWHHKSHYKRWKNGEGWNCASFKLFDEYGFENCPIELVELYPCASKVELLIREDWYMDNNECINEKRAHTSEEQFNEWKAEYHQAHKEERKEYDRQRHIAHKEEHNEMSRQWNEAHKEDISIKRKELVVCECGRPIRKSDLSQHKKSAVHLANIKNLTI